MDYRDVQHITNNLAAKLTCPHCKARITGKYIRLANILRKECIFYVACPRCRVNMVLGAHVYDAEHRTDRMSNASTNICHNFRTQSSISENDLSTILGTLQNQKFNFNELFKK